MTCTYISLPAIQNREEQSLDLSESLNRRRQVSDHYIFTILYGIHIGVTLWLIRKVRLFVQIYFNPDWSVYSSFFEKCPLQIIINAAVDISTATLSPSTPTNMPMSTNSILSKSTLPKTPSLLSKHCLYRRKFIQSHDLFTTKNIPSNSRQVQ